eukprot:Opistho-1_new@47449
MPSVLKKIAETYKIGKTIGEGAFSKVKVAVHRVTGEKVAVKIISKARLKSKSKGSSSGSYLSHLSKDVRLLQLLEHPNIIRLYQVIETDDEFYIFMQFAGGGEIIDYISKKGRLSEKDARVFFRQIVSAIDHCHESRVVHRDLKLENILLSADRNVLISDFGLGRTFTDDLCGTFCGTPLYAAPELVSGIKYPGPPADVWAMGVVLYAMVVGNPPFQAEALKQLYEKIKAVNYTFPDYLSEGIKDLIRKILVKDIAQRYTVAQIREHPWLNEGFDGPPPRFPSAFPKDACDSQLDRVKSIGFQDNAKIYQFNEIGTPHVPLSEDQRLRAASSAVPSPGANNSRNSVTASANSGEFALSQVSGDITLSVPATPVGKDGAEAASGSKDLRLSVDSDGKSIDEVGEDIGEGMDDVAPLKSDAKGTERGNSLRDSRRSAGGMAGPQRRHSIAVTEDDMAKIKVVAATAAPATPVASADDTHLQATPARSEARSPARSPAYIRQRAYSVVTPVRGSGDVVASSTPGTGEINRLYQHRQQQELIQRQPSARRNSISLGPGEKPGAIRSVKGLFTLVASSGRKPEAILADVHRVLKSMCLPFKETGSWTVEVTHVNASYQRVVLEIEVCKVWLLSLHGVSLRRISGDAWLYKEICTSITTRLEHPSKDAAAPAPAAADT